MRQRLRAFILEMTTRTWAALFKGSPKQYWCMIRVNVALAAPAAPQNFWEGAGIHTSQPTAGRKTTAVLQHELQLNSTAWLKTDFPFHPAVTRKLKGSATAYLKAVLPCRQLKLPKATTKSSYCASKNQMRGWGAG